MQCCVAFPTVRRADERPTPVMGKVSGTPRGRDDHSAISPTNLGISLIFVLITQFLRVASCRGLQLTLTYQCIPALTAIKLNISAIRLWDCNSHSMQKMNMRTVGNDALCDSLLQPRLSIAAGWDSLCWRSSRLRVSKDVSTALTGGAEGI